MPRKRRKLFTSCRTKRKKSVGEWTSKDSRRKYKAKWKMNDRQQKKKKRDNSKKKKKRDDTLKKILKLRTRCYWKKICIFMMKMKNYVRN